MSTPLHLLTLEELKVRHAFDRNQVPFTYNDVVQRATDEDDYVSFYRTLAYVFDCDYRIIYEIGNRDYLWKPAITQPVNYLQWIMLEPNRRDPIYEVLSGLFYDKHWDDHDDYEWDDETSGLTAEHRSRVKELTFKLYFEECSIRLWRDKNYLVEMYGYLDWI
jgi:hypothetical protein